MSGLNGRVKALERARDAGEGCPDCGGRMYIGLPDGAPWPAWLDGESCCRRCGNGVKVWPRSLLDRVTQGLPAGERAV